MSNVLPFPRARRRSELNETASKPSASHKAEILLYTGVRYERHADGDSQDASPHDLGRGKSQNIHRRKTRRRA